MHLKISFHFFSKTFRREKKNTDSGLKSKKTIPEQNAQWEILLSKLPCLKLSWASVPWSSGPSAVVGNTGFELTCKNHSKPLSKMPAVGWTFFFFLRLCHFYLISLRNYKGIQLCLKKSQPLDNLQRNLTWILIQESLTFPWPFSQILCTGQTMSNVCVKHPDMHSGNNSSSLPVILNSARDTGPWEDADNLKSSWLYSNDSTDRKQP